MRKTALVVAVLLLATACGESRTGSPRPEAERLPAAVLTFEPDGWGAKELAAVSRTPVRLDAFASWFAGDPAVAEAPDETPDEEEPEPGTTYVVATDSTGCRTPRVVDVSRAGSDLRVRFAGGTDHQACVRPVGPMVHLAVPTREMRGVRTVNGRAPVAATGPARLTDFVELGTIALTATAAELGGTAALRAKLVAAGIEVTGETKAALDRHAGAGERGFAFVLSGCAETSAVLLLDRERISGDLTGGGRVRCAAPVYFLATFVVSADHVPDEAVLS